jgi:hypothetical protein
MSRPRATSSPVDSFGAVIADLNARIRTLELNTHRHKNTYGEFADLADQSTTINTATPIEFDTTLLSNGITVQNTSEITFDAPGVYGLWFSIQFFAPSGTGSGSVWVWLSQNGTTVPDTATRLFLGNNEHTIFALDYLVDITTPSDYCELIWYTDNANIIMEYEPADPPIPAVPSIILNVGRIPGEY